MDMLIKLYDLPAAPPALAAGIAVRKPIGPEHDLVRAWISEHFSRGWASEAGVALANRPASLFIATRDDALLGFCCYDATAKAFVGPIGVLETTRGTGVGAHLLRACLTDMIAVGYGYGIVGYVGAADFFRKVAGAVEIDGSTPGVYGGMLRFPKGPPVSDA
ncbi:MAG: GNAT family N-acetyltransferase [Myxococcota bacterium]